MADLWRVIANAVILISQIMLIVTAAGISLTRSFE